MGIRERNVLLSRMLRRFVRGRATHHSDVRSLEVDGEFQQPVRSADLACRIEKTYILLIYPARRHEVGAKIESVIVHVDRSMSDLSKHCPRQLQTHCVLEALEYHVQLVVYTGLPAAVRIPERLKFCQRVIIDTPRQIESPNCCFPWR